MPAEMESAVAMVVEKAEATVAAERAVAATAVAMVVVAMVAEVMAEVMAEVATAVVATAVAMVAVAMVGVVTEAVTEVVTAAAAMAVEMVAPLMLRRHSSALQVSHTLHDSCRSGCCFLELRRAARQRGRARTPPTPTQEHCPDRSP